MFIINWDDIEGRINPNSFRNVFLFNSKVFEKVKLGKVVVLNPTINFSKLSNEDNVSFIPMEIIDEHYGIVKENKTKKCSEITGFTKFKEGDLLWAKITPCMQNGKSAIAENLINGLGCGSTEFFVIRPRDNKILIKYIHFILRDKRVLKNAENYFGGSAGQQRVSKDYLLNLQIPLPPLSLQQQIIDIMDIVYTKKQEYEQQANELLDSIDSYLLNELGIVMPVEEENTLKSRMFSMSSSEVLSGRFDPYYYKKSFIENLNNIQNGKCGWQKLIYFSIGGLVKGTLPNDKQKNGKYEVVQIKCIDKGGMIDLSDVLTAKEIFTTEQKLMNGDVLIVITGATIGKIALWEYDDEYYLGGDIVKFNTGNHYLNEIYAALLRTKPYQMQIKRCITGATNGHLALFDIEKLPMPNISDEKFQIKIANNINATRKKAKRLEQQADDIIRDAKAKVEKILLEGNL